MSPTAPLDACAEIVERGLTEDLGAGGDITSRTLLAPATRASAQLVAREPLVVAGLALVELVMDAAARRTGGQVTTLLHAQDGARCGAGQPLATVAGSALPILAGERVLLNLVARLSGIATLTARAVAEVAGTGARIADTRKTTPGLRALEKYAVAVGGGENHRATLDALILAKDNHKLLIGGIDRLLERLRAAGVDLAAVEVEVDTLDEFDRALAAGVGWILLDNMTVEDVTAAARRAGGRTRLEVSGGLELGRLQPYAAAGVQRLSLGALTHSARAVDVALDVTEIPP